MRAASTATAAAAASAAEATSSRASSRGKMVDELRQRDRPRVVSVGKPLEYRLEGVARAVLLTNDLWEVEQLADGGVGTARLDDFDAKSTPSPLASMRANASAMASSLRPAAAEEKNSPPPPDSPIRSFELRRSRSAESREARPVEEEAEPSRHLLLSLLHGTRRRGTRLRGSTTWLLRPPPPSVLGPGAARRRPPE